ncbi:hypothetical protein KW492_21015 [Vibrio fluvialis]|nr:hypothetical protein [Vibrio fluvialis]
MRKFSFEFRLVIKVLLVVVVPIIILAYMMTNIFGFSIVDFVSFINAISGFGALVVGIYAISLWRSQRLNTTLFNTNFELLENASSLKFATLNYSVSLLDSMIYTSSKIENHRVRTAERIHISECKLKYYDMLAKIVTNIDKLYVLHYNNDNTKQTKRLLKNLNKFKYTCLFPLGGLYLVISDTNDDYSPYSIRIVGTEDFSFITILKGIGFKSSVLLGEICLSKEYQDNEHYNKTISEDLNYIISFYYEDVVKLLKEDSKYY